MNRISGPTRFAAAAVVVLAAALGGCAKKMWVLHHPEFYSPEIKTIAVVAFNNESGYPSAGKIFTEELAAALRANGTYEIVTGKELAELLDSEGETADSAAGMPREIQAILTGSVIEYRPRSGVEVRHISGYYGDFGYYGWPGYYGYPSYYGWPGYYGFGRHYYPYYGGYYRPYYDSYVYSWNRADVAVTAELIRLPDRARIHSTGVPVGASVYSAGDPPRKDRYQVLGEATAVAVNKLVERLAVVPREVKIDPGKALRLARGRDGQKWRFADDFDSDDEEMYVVLSLPRAADRNRFALTIVREGDREVLASGDIVWSRRDRTRGVRFSPRDLAARGGGPGEYEVRFSSGSKVVMKRDFTIER